MSEPAPLERLDSATRHLPAPLAVLDLAAMRANAADLARRAGGRPIRVASKSVRSREVLSEVLRMPGFRGVMAYSLAEANWLVDTGVSDDILVAYPTADTGAIADLVADRARLAAITLMADGADGLNLIRSAAGSAPVRICLDVDASLRVGPAHLGVRRSPLRRPRESAALAHHAAALGLDVRGVMFYEAQIAGLPDSSVAVRMMKRRSGAELARRRGPVVAAIAEAVGHPLDLVNSGGTGSLEVSSADPVVTEVTAGSGLYCPALFDGYDSFAARPAMYFALPVVRRPAPGYVTAFGGGYVASGPAGDSRLPTVATPGLKLIGNEGAGEVQTPLTGPGADALGVGDRVWFRHAKAGELLERFDDVCLVDGDRLAGRVPSYRGEARNFG